MFVFKYNNTCKHYGTYPELVVSISPQVLAHESGFLAIIDRLETISTEGVLHLQGVAVICGPLGPTQTEGRDGGMFQSG